MSIRFYSQWENNANRIEVLRLDHENNTHSAYAFPQADIDPKHMEDFLNWVNKEIA